MLPPRRRRGAYLLAALSLVGGASVHGQPLEVHPTNPRWLTDDGGETALVLTGAHTWNVFQDYRFDAVFDAGEYLAGLEESGHNFTRGWLWEDGYYAPLPYVAEGGSYRLSAPHDLTLSRRLRKRVRAAERRGLYVGVMLFQGWSLDDHGGRRDPSPWPEHPYNRANTHEQVPRQRARLHVGEPLEQQLEYVSFLVGELCDEPNVFWEVANETVPQSLGTKRAASWQRRILQAIGRECPGRLRWVSCPLQIDAAIEDRKTYFKTLNNLPADLVSPCDRLGEFTFDPPAARGRRVVIADSDHFDPRAVGFEWAWKAFLRGQHPVFLDLTQTLTWWDGEPWNPREARWREVRAALGAIQELVGDVNATRRGSPASGLADLVPQRAAGGGQNDSKKPASSPWALYSANRPCRRSGPGAKCRTGPSNGNELVVYAGPSESVLVCSLAQHSEYGVRWKNPTGHGYLTPLLIRTAGARGCLSLNNPSPRAAIVHLERR